MTWQMVVATLHSNVQLRTDRDADTATLYKYAAYPARLVVDEINEKLGELGTPDSRRADR